LLDHLIIQNVSGSGTAGILDVPSPGPGSSLKIITHCTVTGYQAGIAIGDGVRLLIADSVITENGIGIEINRAGGTLDHVFLYGNTTGVAGQFGGRS
jgi:hypothetical protein